MKTICSGFSKLPSLRQLPVKRKTALPLDVPPEAQELLSDFGSTSSSLCSRSRKLTSCVFPDLVVCNRQKASVSAIVLTQASQLASGATETGAEFSWSNSPFSVNEPPTATVITYSAASNN